MDLDIEMDVDDVHNLAAPTIPEAYTQDLVSEEEQVRIDDGLLSPPRTTR
jgi:hypothetical protein